MLVVLFALVLSISIIGVWASTQSTQSVYLESLDESSMRRIACQNADAVARQYVLNSVVTGSSSPEVAVDLPGGWGSVTIGSSSGVPLESDLKAIGWNQFNWGSGDGYSAEVSVEVTVPQILSPDLAGRIDAEDLPDLTMPRTVQVKSRSPVLSGDLFISNNPVVTSSVSVSGDIAVNGRAVIWQPEDPNSFSPTMNYFTTRSTPTASLAGTFSNFPFPPVTTGPWSGEAFYDGRIDIVHNTSGINSLYNKAYQTPLIDINGAEPDADDSDGVVCDGAGHATITLDDPSLEHVIISSNVTSLTLEGQSGSSDYDDAGNYKAMIIVVNQPENLTSVQLTHRNNRKLVFALKKAAGILNETTTFNAPNAGTGPWRFIAVLEGTPSVWSSPGGTTLALTGGIQTNRALSKTGGSMTISAETEPRLLERLTPRDAWVESYETDG